jgi:hypothetical protein
MYVSINANVFSPTAKNFKINNRHVDSFNCGHCFGTVPLPLDHNY